MREPFLSETLAAFRKIPNRSGRAGRKGVEGERKSRHALAWTDGIFGGGIANSHNFRYH
jgi:hypothetical protein